MFPAGRCSVSSLRSLRARPSAHHSPSPLRPPTTSFLRGSGRWSAGGDVAGGGVGGWRGGGCAAVSEKFLAKWVKRVEFTTRAVTPVDEREGDSATDLSTPYLSVEIRCPKHVAAGLSEALLCFGASSATMDDLSSCDDNDEVCINLIFENCQDVKKCISLGADSIGLKETPHFAIRVIEQYDWTKNAEESFHPIEVTNGLWIVPQWRNPPDIQATNIILNPGMAFGTGEHPTTKLCLLLINGLIKGGESFLDYGTGSGILSIAAVKMGASLSVGVDIDPQAISSAQQNISLNQIHPDKMQLYLTDSEVVHSSMERRLDNDVEEPNSHNSGLSAKRGSFDIVLANILLNPLIELAEEIVSYGKPGAVIGVSGILSDQLPRIEDCYSKYLERISTSEMDGWACLSGIKKMP